MLTMRTSDPLIKLEVDLIILEHHARGTPHGTIARMVGLSIQTVGRRLDAIPERARREVVGLVAEDGPFLLDATKDRLRHLMSEEWRRKERRELLR